MDAVLLVVGAYCLIVVIAYIAIMAWLANLSIRGLFIELWRAMFKRKRPGMPKYENPPPPPPKQETYKIKKPDRKPHATDDF